MTGQASPPSTLGGKTQAVVEGARHLWEQIVLLAPRVLSALAVLIGLWLVALVLRALVRRVLGMTKLDAALEATPVGRILQAFDKELTPSKALAKVIYYAILLMALTSATDMLGLHSVGKVLTSILGYLPTLVSAILVVAAGGYVAGLVSDAIASVLKEMRSPYAKPLAAVAEGAILIIVFTIAIDKLGVDLSFITANLTLIVGAAMVTLCFLFAWSMRRPAEQIIANYYLRQMVSVGDRVVLGDIDGTVERFSAIGLLLRDRQGELCFVPADRVLQGLRRRTSPSAGDK